MSRAIRIVLALFAATLLAGGHTTATMAVANLAAAQTSYAYDTAHAPTTPPGDNCTHASRAKPSPEAAPWPSDFRAGAFLAAKAARAAEEAATAPVKITGYAVGRDGSDTAFIRPLVETVARVAACQGNDWADCGRQDRPVCLLGV